MQIYTSPESSGGLVGLVITSTLSLCANIQWAIRQSAEAENQMTSVERALEYTKLQSEAPFLSSEGGISIRFSCKL
jgi:ATP-binding cassette subfamily C (CFTR/MRP) protein 4